MPSIAFVQAAGNTVVGAGAVAATFGAGTTAGSLLVGVYSSFDNPSPALVAVPITDGAGNTWVPFGASYQDAASPIAWDRMYYCLTALGGATVITATPGAGAANVQNALIVAEFTKPSTLIPFQAEGGPFNAASPGANVPGVIGVLPGPGLMVAAMMSNRTDMQNDVGTAFVALPDQDATGINMVWAYALDPQGAARQTWTRIAAGTVRGAVCQMSFLDSAGFAARPRPVRGRGASW